MKAQDGRRERNTTVLLPIEASGSEVARTWLLEGEMEIEQLTPLRPFPLEERERQNPRDQ